ncbi:CocE/NonD family hydrolase [Nonomuraea sp. NPDC050663]|uniref:CocE/NonD family hydrolase n=1 Tax=Nonomuraea sp. NPDC050663 TaxID=3364370 RepID=UPI0037926B83
MIGRLIDRLMGLPQARTNAVTVTRNLRVPMPDGTVLLADRYRPQGVAGPLPVVLIRTPYGRANLESRLLGGALSRQGFQVVAQSVRGTFGSGGTFMPFAQERADGLATAAWLRAQPWCDGRLATAGNSYGGYTQWAFGPYLERPLSAMCLGITASGLVNTFYPGGTLALHNLLGWSSLITVQESAPLGAPISPLYHRKVERAKRHLPLATADLAAVGRPSAFFRDVVDHDRAFWAESDHSPAAAGLTTPASMVSGWYDIFLPETIADFAAGRNTRITIGPWGHDAGAIRAGLVDAVSWLRAHLMDDGAQLRRAPVRLHLQNARQWLDFDSWPPPATPTTLHLSPRGGLGWEAPVEPGHDTFVYDPSDPTPTVGGPLLGGKGGQRDQRELERRRDVLVYTSAPLTRDLDLVGPVTARVAVRTDTGFGDLFVRLCDVDQAGLSRNVTDGVLRLSPGDDEVTVELFPTGYRFLRGHRLRVQVSGGSFPRFGRNHGTGEPVASAVAGKRVSYEIGHTSALTLPVLT